MYTYLIQQAAQAQTEHRTIVGQIQYWAMVGRAALDNPDLPVMPWQMIFVF